MYSVILSCPFADTVCPGLHSHQPVLLHEKVWLPGSHLDPPYLDVRCLLLPPLLQLLDTGLHQGQEAACRSLREAAAEWFNQRSHLCNGQWETPRKRARQPPHQWQGPCGQSKRDLTFWLWILDEGLEGGTHIDKHVGTAKVPACIS